MKFGKKNYLILVVQMKTIANHDSELSGNISSPSDYKFLQFFCEKKNERSFTGNYNDKWKWQQNEMRLVLMNWMTN